MLKNHYKSHKGQADERKDETEENANKVTNKKRFCLLLVPRAAVAYSQQLKM